MILLLIASFVVANLDQAGSWPNSPTGFVQRITIFVELSWVTIVALHLVRARQVERTG